MIDSVTAIERVLSRGSSFPSVVTTASGRRYVMKLSGAGPGRRALATELVALGLARHIGLNVPAAAVLSLPRDLPWQVGTDEFYEAVQRSAGLNLGVAYLAGAEDVRAAELASLPESFLGPLAGADALLQNFDRTASNPNVMRDSPGACWAIDFGACLLLERLARRACEPTLDLPSNHFLAADHRFERGAEAAARGISAWHTSEIVHALPDAWVDDLAIAREELLARLDGYLARLHGG